MSQLGTEVANPEPLKLRDVTTLLIRHYGYTEGLWDLAVEIQFGAGQVGPAPANALPGAIIAISRIGLSRATALTASTIDAAAISAPEQVSPPTAPAAG